jgi:hypothetical protein
VAAQYLINNRSVYATMLRKRQLISLSLNGGSQQFVDRIIIQYACIAADIQGACKLLDTFPPRVARHLLILRGHFNLS